MGDISHFEKVVKYSQCDGVAIADMLHYSKIKVDDIKNFSSKNNINIRN